MRATETSLNILSVLHVSRLQLSLRMSVIFVAKIDTKAVELRAFTCKCCRRLQESALLSSKYILYFGLLLEQNYTKNAS